jgi:hypothetical protein
MLCFFSRSFQRIRSDTVTPSEAYAKQLYDRTVAQKVNEGFTPRPDLIAADKAERPGVTECWRGINYGSGQGFSVEYSDNPYVSSWLVMTESI